MDFSRLNYPQARRRPHRLGGDDHLDPVPARGTRTTPGASKRRPSADAWICGVGEDSCTGFETFPILRWLLLLAALAPIILAYILVRAHRLSYPPGEMTMVAGFAAFVLIAYNGIIDKPGSGAAEIGLSLDYGYWIALICSVAIAGVGWTRSLQSGARKARKAPGTV